MSEPVTLPVGEIVCGDCLEVMRGWPDKCVDWCITDPPYGMNIGELAFSRGTDKIGGRALATRPRDYRPDCDWDTNRPSAETFAEILRVSRNQIIFGGNFFADLLPPSRCWIAWDKGRRNNFADCELAWTSLDDPARVINYHYDGCMTAMPNRELPRVHPTQKPVPVMEWLINRYCKAGEVICDPFCGSGTTLTAAQRLGFSWLGIELNPAYVEIAKARTAQQGLFTEVAQ